LLDKLIVGKNKRIIAAALTFIFNMTTSRSFSLKRKKHPPIASWPHRRKDTQTLAYCNRDIFPQYT
jgi:hypothetical protein